jgi:hypothetical protein
MCKSKCSLYVQGDFVNGLARNSAREADSS